MVNSLYNVTKLPEKLNVTSAGLEVGLQTHSKKPAFGTCRTWCTLAIRIPFQYILTDVEAFQVVSSLQVFRLALLYVHILHMSSFLLHS